MRFLVSLLLALIISSPLSAQTPGTIPPSTAPHIPMTGFRGVWDANHDYPTGSVVSYNGLAYVAKTDSSHRQPVQPDTDATATPFVMAFWD